MFSAHALCSIPLQVLSSSNSTLKNVHTVNFVLTRITRIFFPGLGGLNNVYPFFIQFQCQTEVQAHQSITQAITGFIRLTYRGWGRGMGRSMDGPKESCTESSVPNMDGDSPMAV